jgi:hypothetical protein
MPVKILDLKTFTRDEWLASSPNPIGTFRGIDPSHGYRIRTRLQCKFPGNSEFYREFCEKHASGALEPLNNSVGKGR